MRVALRSWVGIVVFWLLACPAPADADPVNLAANPSFETAAEGQIADAWRGPADTYARDASVARTGQASLHFRCDDAERYRLCSESIPLEPGRKYRVSVWVKTREVAGNDNGASVCVEWSDKEGQWLGGRYPKGVTGTADWTQVVEAFRVPLAAGACTLTCYGTRGTTGEAWFDDLEVVRMVDPPLRTVLVRPVYRGRITADGPREAVVRARLKLADLDLRAEDVRLEADLLALPEERVLQSAAARPAARAEEGTLESLAADLALPVADLPEGRYAVAVRLLGPDGRVLGASRHALVREPESFRPRVAIDEHQRLIVDGKPFFPLGVYWGSIREDDLKIYAQSKFNCLMPYASPDRAGMDLAQRYGLRVIYSVKDMYYGSTWCPASIRSVEDEEPLVRSRIREFRDHPALLAWYLNDELSQNFVPRLEAHHRWVTEDDPNHPDWSVLYQIDEIAAYLETFDAVGSDPYPVGRKPVSEAFRWTRTTRQQVEQARPLWQVPQLHNWANYAETEAEKAKLRTPTTAEVRNMAWQCICEGARGLVFYSWNDLKRNADVSFEQQWTGLKETAAEIDRWAPVLLSVEEASESVAPVTPPAWLHWTVRRTGGETYLFVVNDGDGEGAVRFRLADPKAAVREPGPGTDVAIAEGVFEVGLAPLDVRVFVVGKKP